jgi:hypothetical protein
MRAAQREELATWRGETRVCVREHVRRMRRGTGRHKPSCGRRPQSLFAFVADRSHDRHPRSHDRPDKSALSALLHIHAPSNPSSLGSPQLARKASNTPSSSNCGLRIDQRKRRRCPATTRPTFDLTRQQRLSSSHARAITSLRGDHYDRSLRARRPTSLAPPKGHQCHRGTTEGGSP